MACWPAWKHGTIAALLTALVVFLDVTWPSLSIFYFLPTLYVAWAMRGRAEWILYGALTVTVLLAPFLGAPNRVSAKGTLNRALGVSVGLFMAYLIRERRRNADRLQCLSEQLEARVEERSAELNATVDRLRQSEQELRQHLAELTVLNRMGVICSEVSTDDELLHRATTLITETLFPDNCGFLLLDADRGVLVTHPSFVLSDPAVSRADKALGTGITGQVALSAMRDGNDMRAEEWEITRKDGARRTLSISTSLVETDTNIHGVVALMQDVTERKQAIVELRQSEARYRQLVENSPYCIHELDAEGRFLSMNAAGLRMMGQDDPACVRGSHYLDAVSAADRPLIAQRLESAKAGTPSFFEFTAINGRFFSSNFVPLSGGTTMGITQDITEHKRATEALHESEARYRLIAELASSFSYQAKLTVDDQVSFQWVGGKFQEVTGYQPEELSGPGWFALIPQEDLPRILEQVAGLRSPESDLSEALEVRIRTRAGELRWIRSVMHVKSPAELGEPITVYGAVLDITERKHAEEALEMMRFSVDHAGDSVFWVSPTGHILYVNDAACAGRGYSRDELLSMTVFDLDPDFQPVVWEPHFEDLRNHGTLTFETRHRAKDGRVFPIEVNANYVHIGNQEFNFAFVRDITERKRAEEALRQSEEQYRVILETLPVGVLIHDGQQMYYANPKAAQILGVQHPDELSQIDPMEIVAPEYRELARGRVETTLRTGHSLPSIEAVVLRVDGSRVNVEVNSRRTHFAGQDCMQVLFHDITDRKHAEETIQRILDGIAPTTGQEFFSTLVKYLCDVCGVEFALAGAIDPDHPHEVQTIACSRRGQPIENFRYDIRGTPCEHVIGKTLCFHPTRVQEQFPQDHMLVEMGIDSYMGIPLWSSHGDPLGLIALLNDRAFPDPVQTQVILQVVAARCGAELERQRAEDRFRKNEERMLADLSLRQRDLLHASRLNAIGQMVAGLSHEVAQPLNAISNFAVASTRLLDSDTSGTPNALREYVQAIVVQSQRCAAILRRLRDFSRRTPTVKTACDLNSLLIESVELIASETRRKHARVQLDLATELPQVSADRVQIQQVVFNLLNNALEAVQDQEIDHRLMTVRSRAETDSVTLEVEDHGSGITPEIAQQLFEPFFTTKRDGMGIGLNICETIVRDHGGRIEVESNEYGGATFRVHLPFPREDGSISGQIPGVVQ